MKYFKNYKSFLTEGEDPITETDNFIEPLNEEEYDFVRDIESALGRRPSQRSVEDYLGRSLSDWEKRALGYSSSYGGYRKSYKRKSSYGSVKKTINTSAPLTFGKFKGKMWEDVPEWYKKWAGKTFNII